jgi:hypothetical protein
MSISVKLTSEIEAKLRERATSQSLDVSTLAAQLLTEALNKSNPDVDPWSNFAGLIEADQLFDDFIEDMAAYRRELDAEVAAHELSLEISQSA